MANDFLKKRILRSLDPRNIRCEIIGSSIVPGMEDGADHLARNIIHRYMGGADPPEATFMQKVVKEAMASTKIGFSSILDNPDELVALGMGKGQARSNLIWYWDVFPPISREKPCFVLITYAARGAYDRFLQNRLPEFVWAFNGAQRTWGPDNPEILGLEHLLAEASIDRQALSKSLFVEGARKLATVFPSSALPGVTFVTLSSLESVDRSVFWLRLAFFLGALFVFGIIFLLSKAVSASILIPVRALEGRIEALEQRMLGYRLPDMGKDEFGSLASAFNEMLEERQDLDLAREVQEHIIPQVLPEIAGYDIGFKYRPVGQLGGDYCDVIPLPDGRIMFLVADVTGHGISSALLTTMAKTIVTMYAGKGMEIPSMLKKLNRFVYQLFQRKKLMTIVLGVLDPVKNSLTLWNAGHPFPIVKATNDPGQYLALINMPMGVRRASEWAPFIMDFKPGTSLLLYTDGLPEMESPDGKMLGFDGFLQKARESQGSSSEALMDDLVTRCVEFRGKFELEDDLTLMVLYRKTD